MAYGRFIEPRWLDVTRVRVESPHLVGATRPIRIAQISDTHCEVYAGLDEGLADTIAGLSPDVIVFTGDALNSRAAAPRFRRLMTRLAKIAPTLVVKGNWDVVQYRDVDLFSGTGVRELAGEAVKLHIAGADVWFAGAPMYDKAKFAAALAAVPKDKCTVFLFHHPDAAVEVAAHGGVDLQLSGHTHGGQVAIPGFGALITMSSYGNRFERGLCKVGRMHVYVNRGLGMEGNAAPRVRFGSRPELTLIELTPKKAAR